MKKWFYSATLCVSMGMSASVCAQTVSQADLVSLMAKNLAKESGKPLSSEQMDRIKGSIALQQKFAQKARAEGIDKQPDTQKLLYLQESQLLMQEYLRIKAEAYNPTDAELKSLYESEVAKTQEYHLKHILVKTEKEAQEIIAQLKQGKPFEVLAKKSIDPSGAKGGDLDWQPMAMWVPEFANAASHLAKGEFTQVPVQSQYGYHVILMVDGPRKAQTVKVPDFNSSKPQLLEYARQQYVNKLQDEEAQKN